MTTSGVDPRDQELIAAFIDRRMNEGERRAFMERLDREEALYEVFVETVRFRDQLEGRQAPVIAHPASRQQWGRLAAVAAVVAISVATPVALRNLAAQRHTAALVADGTLDAVLEEGWFVKHWAVTRGAAPGTGELGTAFRLGVRQVDVEVALRTGRRADAELLAAEVELLLGAVPRSAALQLSWAEIRRRIGEPEWALRRIEEAESPLRAHLGEAADAFDLGSWTEAGVLAARSGNTELLLSPAFRRELKRLRRRDRPQLAGELAAIGALLEPPAERLDLPRLEAAFGAVIEQG